MQGHAYSKLDSAYSYKMISHVLKKSAQIMVLTS